MPGRPRRADALRNREAILTAARDLVITRGPNVGMDDIAAAAGVAVGTLYRHFPTKQDLVDDIVTELSTAVGESLDSAVTRVHNGTNPAVDELIDLLRRAVMEMRQERLLRFAIGTVAAESIRELQEHGRGTVEQLVASAHDANALHPDVTTDDVILLLATAPDDSMPDPEKLRWLTLARRALTTGAPES